MIKPIADEEIYEVCSLLGLPLNAFHGINGDDSRAAVLKSFDTLDVEACPGSGKTTLLVAKLALLANRWPYLTKGICVLSHTNAARDEIEGRLGATIESQVLLGYPNFIGTIHSFVNEYIAIPWLKSYGYYPQIIEDDVVLEWRWNALPPFIKQRIERSPLYRDRPQKALKIINTNFDVNPINVGRGQYLQTGDSQYKAISTICKRSYENGLMCFDEMFIWAHDALDKNCYIREIIRTRFPFHFIDEVQDNSDIQSDILFKIFMEGNEPSVRQRFGDSNQAIYSYSGQSGAVIDQFPSPNEDIRRELPNSHRFGKQIACLANNLILNELEHGLKGCGPNENKSTADTDNQHTLFLFNSNEIDKVLPAYAEHILNVFKDDPIGLQRGDFVATGAVHNTPKNKIQEQPHYLGHYFPQYKAKTARKEYSMESFPEYISFGLQQALEQRVSSPIVQKYSDAIVKGVKAIGGSVSFSQRKNLYRHILKKLEDKPELLALYEKQVLSLISGKLKLSQDLWENEWQNEVITICSGLSEDFIREVDIPAFFFWPTEMANCSSPEESVGNDNTYYYPNKDAASVSIRLGSIHSVKGQSHTATLVLDTYQKAYHFKMLKKWILGERLASNKINDALANRLKLHYVAMTRPTHLLCVAMRKDFFTLSELEILDKESHWKIERL